MHYKGEVIKNIKTLLGSMKLVGNPSHMFREFKTGAELMKNDDNIFRIIKGVDVIASASLST